MEQSTLTTSKESTYGAGGQTSSEPHSEVFEQDRTGMAFEQQEGAEVSAESEDQVSVMSLTVECTSVCESGEAIFQSGEIKETTNQETVLYAEPTGETPEVSSSDAIKETKVNLTTPNISNTLPDIGSSKGSESKDNKREEEKELTEYPKEIETSEDPITNVQDGCGLPLKQTPTISPVESIYEATSNIVYGGYYRKQLKGNNTKELDLKQVELKVGPIPSDKYQPSNTHNNIGTSPKEHSEPQDSSGFYSVDQSNPHRPKFLPANKLSSNSSLSHSLSPSYPSDGEGGGISFVIEEPPIGPQAEAPDHPTELTCQHKGTQGNRS
jgi:hypothetical protein